MACTVYSDWSGTGVTGFQGNCYAVTNAQIYWMQANAYLIDLVRAPNNSTCATKSELESYTGTVNGDTPYFALSSNSLVPIGYFGGNT